MKYLMILFLTAVCLCTGCSSEVNDQWEDASLYAVITSDLHLSSDPDTVASIVPAMPYGEAVAQVIASQVIRLDPDVFIMTGDNTNSGAAEDMEVLKEILQKIRDAGITVILTTGNHDFNQCTPEAYWTCYSELLTVSEKDPASLSYITEIGNTWLFAMDDNSVDLGRTGTFSDETMAWLETNLKAARDAGKTVLFLSHHNVLAGPKGDNSSSYQITNRSLRPLLKKMRVPLCLTGHQHGQVIQSEDDLYEIISSMPLSGLHQIGELRIDGRSASYRTTAIEFARLGSEALAAEMAEADRKETEGMQKIFIGMLEEKGLSEQEKEGVLSLISRFFRCYSEGTLAENAASIRQDEYYECMMKALQDENYGPWMEQVLNDPPREANMLDIAW